MIQKLLFTIIIFCYAWYTITVRNSADYFRKHIREHNKKNYRAQGEQQYALSKVLFNVATILSATYFIIYILYPFIKPYLH